MTLMESHSPPILTTYIPNIHVTCYPPVVDKVMDYDRTTQTKIKLRSNTHTDRCDLSIMSRCNVKTEKRVSCFLSYMYSREKYWW